LVEIKPRKGGQVARDKDKKRAIFQHLTRPKGGKKSWKTKENSENQTTGLENTRESKEKVGVGETVKRQPPLQNRMKKRGKNRSVWNDTNS